MPSSSKTSSSRSGNRTRSTRGGSGRRTRSGQLPLQLPNRWGGKRAGAGRKPKGQRAGVAHRSRNVPPHPDRGALHVTLHVVDGLPSLREPKCMRALWTAFSAGKQRFGLRLCHFAVQKNHIHLIVEVESREALYRGMRGLCIRIARQLNSALGRRGRVLADRYHSVALDSFKRLRAALCYVIQNERRHCYQHGGWQKSARYIDPCSSGRYFDGWRDVRVHPPSGLDPPVVAPAGYALQRGWRRHGLIGLQEIPAKAASDRARRRRARAQPGDHREQRTRRKQPFSDQSR